MSMIAAPLEHLDLATVLKVSQAVSGEMALEKLLDTLMRTAVEHAGAERALLMLAREAGPRIAAEATTSNGMVVVRLHDEPVTGSLLPEAILRHVLRTRENVILDDASALNPFSTDPYIARRHPRSVFCLPLMNQAKLIGVLYLENNLAPSVFAAARTAVLKLLASQAAISIENSRLYRNLAERESRIRRLVDANIVGIFVWQLEGRILEANDAFLAMVGYDREDLVASRLRWTELTPPEWRDRDERLIPELARSGTLAFVLDLTERKRAAEALRESQEALARANRATTLGMLGASIAHEVNQPLGAIAASAAAGSRWLSARPPDLDKAQRSLERIAKDIKRASTVIQRLRALVKRQAPRKDRVDLNEAIVEVLALTDDEVRRHDILVETSLAADLPTVEGDRIQIQQIILNLVVNAIEAMRAVDDGNRRLAIGSAREDANGVRVEVRDSGPGIDPSHADRLFEAFYTTKAEGMGMGLCISRAIIEAHGGRLWVGANGSHGAAFYFSLPVQVAA
jgi:C4-dicarboxylate-specific signal transduction histidine kinase